MRCRAPKLVANTSEGTGAPEGACLAVGTWLGTTHGDILIHPREKRPVRPRTEDHALTHEPPKGLLGGHHAQVVQHLRAVQPR
jgi:hypothetical protein